MKILVTGATGYVGGRLVPELLNLGHSVRVLARSPGKLSHRDWKGVEIFGGDAFDPASLEIALQGVEVAYYLIHSMTTSGAAFGERDLIAAKNFGVACRTCGVKRIIYLGGLGSKGQKLSKHLQSRQETGEALRGCGVPVTEFRSGVIIGSGSASFEIIRDLVKKLPLMICPRWVQSKSEPIAIRQVLAYLTGALSEPRTVGEILEIGGGEVLTYAEMMRQCAEVMGKRLWIIPVPILTPRLSAYWLNLVTSVPFSLARPLVEGLANDLLCADFRIREWIPVPEMSYREAVRRALSKEQEGAVHSRWTDATTSRAIEPIDEVSFHYTDMREAYARASKEALFLTIRRLGGKNGWFHANWLWRLRASLDWVLGGVGMRRGRPLARELAIGDPVDFWRVESLTPERELTLRAEMKLPGTARLSFELSDGRTPEESRIVMTARFWPSGMLGKIYWYLVLPLHHYVFSGMLSEIVRHAESRRVSSRLN